VHDGITENLRFLVIEVEKQLRRTGEYLLLPTPEALTRIIDADDYIDNLKASIQSKSFDAATHTDNGQSGALLRSFEIVASNLERIADFCEKIILQVSYIDQPLVYARYDFGNFLRQVVRGVGHVEAALLQRDLELALKVCRVEQNLDELYAGAFQRILSELQSAERADTRSLLSLLFIAHYLERMGDALLNIGEAILSLQLGERVKLGQLRAFGACLDPVELSARLRPLSLESMAETRSGARVKCVSRRGAPHPASPALIFKQGKTHKLLQERDSITRWQELVPGVAPSIYSFHADGADSALLLEYLPGATFESILLRQPWPVVEQALEALLRKLSEVWRVTRREERIAPRFLNQLSARFADILAVHAEFGRGNARLGHKQIAAFPSLIEQLLGYDESLQAPFSVFIHGDFNLDNIIYAAEGDSVRFIDLHRSAPMDYVQDISVFLVSLFRLRCMPMPIRTRIRRTLLRFLEFARGHARSLGDATFNQRLALGVARSLATSTRFVLDTRLARSMFLRSRYILERLAELQPTGQMARFELASEVLVD
jgi:phosphate uptake regulator/aminoglycoside phosphotransferase (APT) family kinase protein